MKKVILQIDHTAQPGGAELWLLDFVIRMKRQGIPMELVLGEAGGIGEGLEEEGIPTYVSPMPSVSSVISLFRSIKTLVKLIKEKDAAAVHCHSLRSNIIGGIAGKIAGVKVIWHFHESMVKGQVKGIYLFVTRLLISWIPDYIVANSSFTKDTLQMKKEAIVVYPTISTSEYNSIPERMESLKGEKITVTMIGRIAHWKGQHVFIEAAKKLHDKYKNVRFLIAGAPLFGKEEYLLQLQKQVEQYGLEDIIEFLGHIKDVPLLLSNTDIAVHCSIDPEPFGQVIIQAMAAGKPVITTAHGGPLEMIDHELNGILVPPNIPEVLAEELEKLVNNEGLRREIGAAAKLKAEAFDHAHQDEKMVDIFKEL